MNLAEDPRAAGGVRRYHTWAVHQNQTVAEHTWQILRILLTIWPQVPRSVLIHAVTHDMGEMAGDIQYPFKLLFPELGAGSVKTENYVRDQQRKGIGAPPETHPLSPYEKHVFKLCDNLEMWEFGLREINFGNRYGIIIRNRMSGAIAANLANVEALKGQKQYEDNPSVVPAVHRYMKKRQEMENISG